MVVRHDVAVRVNKKSRPGPAAGENAYHSRLHCFEDRDRVERLGVLGGFLYRQPRRNSCSALPRRCRRRYVAGSGSIVQLVCTGCRRARQRRLYSFRTIVVDKREHNESSHYRGRQRRSHTRQNSTHGPCFTPTPLVRLLPLMG